MIRLWEEDETKHMLEIPDFVNGFSVVEAVISWKKPSNSYSIIKVFVKNCKIENLEIGLIQ